MTEQSQERWALIPGFERYEVSTLGHVRSYFLRGSKGRRLTSEARLLKQQISQRGYLAVQLRATSGRRKWLFIHRLVLLAFAERAADKQTDVRHLDGNRQNNNLTNLSWGTRKENEADKDRHRRRPVGERHYKAKLTAEQVMYIRAVKAANSDESVPQNNNHWGRKALASQLGVSVGAVQGAAAGRTWRHLEAGELNV
jgi:hypothetical protein